MEFRQKISVLFTRTLLLLGILSLILACSRKKNTWLNRNFHTMAAYYNILYHGNLALEEGVYQLKKATDDNYWDILPIEQLQQREEPIVYGQLSNSSSAVSRKNTSDRSAKSLSREKAQNAPKKENQIGPSRKILRNEQQQNNLNNFGIKAEDQYTGKNNNPSLRNNPLNTGSTPQGFNPGRQGNQHSGQPQNTSYERNNMSNRNPQVNTPGNPLNNRSSNMLYQESSVNDNQRFGNNRSNGIGLNNSSRNSFRQAPGPPRELRAIDTLSINDNFNRAEEKATKAIQKHSMVINDKEHNSQIAKAFLLLGKSRYYDQRYFPALESFNYILRHYNDQRLRNSAAIWKEKTYLRLGNNEKRVIKNFTAILNGNPELHIDTTRISQALKQAYLTKKDRDITQNLLQIYFDRKKVAERAKEPLSKKNITQASAMLTQAYLKIDQKEKALKPLQLAINTTRNKKKKGRFLFIKGQILEQLLCTSEAKATYDKVIALNRRIPRIYHIQAYMRKARLLNQQNGKQEEVLNTLQHLLKDRENRPYLDIINYQVGEYYKAIDSLAAALPYYNQALDTNIPIDHQLRSRIYKTLGHYYFNNANYRSAAAYYDSTMVNLPQISKAYYTIRKKREQLNEVIKYEEIAMRNDSVLNLVHLSPQKRQAYFKNYTDSIKAKALAEAKASQNSESVAPKNNLSRRGNLFYFYQPEQVAAGKKAFMQLWGNRKLQDNWRTKSTPAIGSQEEREETKGKTLFAALENDPKYQVQTYLDLLPKKKTVIDSITDQRNFAYYQLGLIYYEKFEEYELASQKLEDLLDNKPKERLILPTEYNLYQIYKHLKESSKAIKWKEKILADYPESRYAKVLNNPKSLLQDKNNPEKIYNTLYKKYKAGYYKKALQEIEKYSVQYTGDQIEPKLALLKATVKGRLYGLATYKKELQDVALTYPQSEAGKKADKLLTTALPQMENATFTKETARGYKLIYPYKYKRKRKAEKAQTTIKKTLNSLGFNGITVTVDNYSYKKVFIVLSGFQNRNQIKSLLANKDEEKGLPKNRDHFIISSENYEIILIHKNLSAYREIFDL